MTAVQQVRINDIEIAYRIDGDRAPTRPWLVFSHSLACDHTMWDAQAREFSAGCNVLRFDTRGHGQSSAPAAAYSLEELADDLRGLLDALAIERCHYVGLSMGGMIGQMAALRDPLRFVSLVLADTTSRFAAEMSPVWQERIASVSGPEGMAAVVDATLDRWFTPMFRQADPDEVARIGSLIRATPVAGYIGCIHAISALNLTPRLEIIQCPVLVLVGEEDRTTPPAMAEEIVQAIAGARYVRLPQAAHLSNVEQAAAFNQALREFYTQIG